MNLIDTMLPNPFKKLIDASVSADLSMSYIGTAVIYVSLFIILNYWMLNRGNVGK